MKPHVVGSACHRVQQALDEAMAEGVLQLSPELTAHASKCPRCGPDWRETEALLSRLRGAAAGIDLGRVPQVVDYVMARTAAESPLAPAAAVEPVRPREQKKRADLKWVLGQVAAVAAVVVLAAGGLTYTVLKVNEVVSGVKPVEVVEKLGAPFRELKQALFPSAR